MVKQLTDPDIATINSLKGHLPMVRKYLKQVQTKIKNQMIVQYSTSKQIQICQKLKVLRRKMH